MSLKGRQFLSKQVPLSDGGDPATVRGLSLTDISQIVLANRAEAIDIFSTIMSKKNNMTPGDIAGIADNMLLMAPNLTATIIAAGTGDIDAYTDILRMPFGDQLLLVHEIGELTFKTNGGPGKVWEIVVKMLQSANGFLAK